MNVKEIITMITTVIIGIILVSVVFVPILNGLLPDQRTFSNEEESYGYYHKYNVGDEYQLTWDANDGGTAYANGLPVTLFNGSVIFDAGNWTLRYGVESNGPYLQTVGPDNIATQSAISSTTITVNGNEMTIVSPGAYTIRETIEDSFYALSNRGEYVMKRPNQNAYINDHSSIVAMGITTIDSNFANVFYIHGSIRGGIDVEWVRSTTTGTIQNVVVNATSVDGYDDLSQLSSITFDVVTENGTTNVVYNYFLVPSKVVAPVDSDIPIVVQTMINILPILISIALLLSVVITLRINLRT